MMKQIINLFKNTHGTTAIEFAIILPACLLFLFGIMELGYVMWGSSSLKYAATYASRYAYINRNQTPTNIRDFAMSKIFLSGNPIDFTVTKTLLTVDIDGTFQYSFLVIPMSPITITTHIHQNVPTTF